MSGNLRRLIKYWEPLELRDDIDHVRNRKRRERRILTILDGIGFSWRVYAVALLGFLASSWSLIALNITTPALSFVYPQAIPNDAGLVLDVVTLSGTVVGMVVFGHLADRFGRSALYGFELLIVLSAIGGAAFSSQGFFYTEGSGDSSMSIYASLIWWRSILGLGIGAEYPMSAVIAAEFASTEWRGIMLAAIFLAQPIGRFLAYGLSLAIIGGFKEIQVDHGAAEILSDKVTVDKIWRLVLGLAGVPAVFAIGLRFFIPETPRFYSAIERDLRKALEVVTRIGSKSPRLQPDNESFDSEGDGAAPDAVPAERTPWGSSAYIYLFGKTQGWKRLFSISLQWLLLDVAFYGTGLDSPPTLAALMQGHEPPDHDKPRWNANAMKPNATIYETMHDNAVRSLEISSLAALCGSLLIIPLLDYVHRRTLYIWTSGALAILFAGSAAAFRWTYKTQYHMVTVVFYALTQFLFNVGPNTLTFILASEVFPTEFRGTCYGIAAAAGKLGAILIRPIMDHVAGLPNVEQPYVLTIFLSIFAVILALMTLLAWIEPWGIGIPRVQQEAAVLVSNRPRLPDGSEKIPAVDYGVESWWERYMPRPLVNLSLEDISPWPIEEIEEIERTSSHSSSVSQQQQQPPPSFLGPINAGGDDEITMSGPYNKSVIEVFQNSSGGTHEFLPPPAQS